MSEGRTEIYVGRGGELVFWHKMVDAIAAVCQLTLDRDTSETISAEQRKASGSLVRCNIDGDGVVAILTNHHVVNNKEEAAKFVATFNYDGRGETKIINLRPDILFKTGDKDHDYTMVGVNEEDIDYLKSQLRISPLALKPLAQGAVDKIRIIHIAQHPNGKLKKLSMGRLCEVQSRYILYDADTSSGSSGSPVFFVENESCCVLALHKSGGVSTSACKEQVNKGILINVILNHVNGERVEVLEIKNCYLQSSAALTSQEFTRIGIRIPDKWERVALATNKFHKYETDNIKGNITSPEPIDKAIQMLNAFQRRLGTREELSNALKELGEDDLAEKVLWRYFQFYAA